MVVEFGVVADGGTVSGKTEALSMVGVVEGPCGVSSTCVRVV